MGVLYDVLFKPPGRGGAGAGGDGNSAVPATTTTSANPADRPGEQMPPEWVLDGRDGGTLVWRRYGVPVSCRRKRVRFLDAVQVRVFEKDDYGDRGTCTSAGRHSDGGGGGGDDDDDDGQPCWADDWSSWDDGSKTTLFYRDSDRDDFPAIVIVSVTVLGLCIGLAYLFAPVRWLVHQLLLVV